MTTEVAENPIQNDHLSATPERRFLAHEAKDEQHQKQAFGDEVAPTSGIRPANNVEQEDLPESSYSEQLARDLSTRQERVCPHGRERYCRSCGVRERHELRDGGWSPVWHPIERRVA